MSDEEKLPAPKRPEIIDPHVVPIGFADWFVTGGMFSNVVNIALGAIDHSRFDAERDLARVVVTTRLRMSREFAVNLHTALGDILGINAPNPGDDPMPPAPNPPKNMIN